VAPSSTSSEKNLADFLQQDRSRGFDLATAPLWRLTVFPWDQNRVTTIWTFHHALLDGRSHAQVWQEVDKVYHSLLRGITPELPPARPFREFASWLASKSDEPSAAYWRERLNGFQAGTDLPSLSDSPASGDDQMPPTMETRVLPQDVTARLRDAAQRHGVTLNNLVQGAWALALARYQAVEEVTFGVVRSGRHWTEVDPNGRIGMFINTIPFRVNTAPTQPIGTWLQSLRAQQLAARPGEHASIEDIRRWCNLPRSTALFHTALMFENHNPAHRLSTATQAVRLIEKTDIPTLAVLADDTLTLTLDYSPQRHPAAQIQIVLRHVQTLLESLSSAPADLPLGDLKMFPTEDARLIFDQWQGPVTGQPAAPLHRLLETVAAKYPQSVAVELSGQTITYADLHRQANQLARRLLQFCQPGDRIAVVLDRSLQQPAVWLAALKAGLVYAPVDPANPRERLEFLFSDLQPAVVLTETGLSAYLPSGNLRMLCVDDPAERAVQATLDSGPVAGDPPSGSAANLLYTSGSTGLPKAAINSRLGLDNFAGELRRTFDFGPADRVLQSSSTSFDASLFDFVAALQSGATLVIVPPDQLRPGPDFTQMLLTQRISVVLLTPTVMCLTPAPPPPALRVLISAGEALTSDLLKLWAAGRRVFNVCGPTECSVWFNCEESKSDGNRPTIGSLVQNCRGYVLDEKQQPVAVGVPGELYLGGAGVGLGYWRRPELTAARYLTDPFSDAPNARMYRTGDRVRWLADGRIEYLGRLDFQVKVHGVRVELGEIESALRQHPAVADAALILHEDQLLAWLVPQGQSPSDAALRAWLADHIPQIFTPKEFHRLPQFPRTLTGKADRPALLAAWLASRTSSQNASQPALSPAERQRVLEEWNQTQKPYPLHRSVVDFFEEQARLHPDAPALKSGPMVVSYAALNNYSNYIASKLLQAGLRLEDIVVLRFDRSIAFVASALAVLKAGGSYLPLDVNVPATRQDFVLQDSGARFALTTPEHISAFAKWSGWSTAVSDEDLKSDVAVEPNPVLSNNPQRRAYVIYTSGSTGQPKGVEIEHHSLSNLVSFYRDRLQLAASDQTTLLANPTFDASVADVWPILCAGGSLLIPERKLLSDPDGLIAWLCETGATFSFVPTALGELMFSRPWPKKCRLRFLCVGGETLRIHPPGGLPFEVLNSYGPTENTVDATWEIIPPATAASSRPGIGKPIANVRAYVLDERLEPVAIGVEGELFLSGEQVARGYLNRPELTRERFLSDPFSTAPAARMYRTGDRVRWRPDGNLEFFGRNDDQVQVHGQRVELGEIETTLRQHPGIREVCCRPFATGKETSTGAVDGVVAHVVMPGVADESVATELRRFLEPLLPAYMVPAIFITHPVLPLTPQGKVNRQALDLAAQAHGETTVANPPAVPSDSLVRAMTGLWQRILPNGIGARSDESFQQLGGDSLAAVKLLLGVEDITGRRLALSTFLIEPTLAGLCRAVAAAEEKSQQPILALHRAGTRPPLFCLYEVTGDVGVYFELAAAMSADQPVFGIRSSALHHAERIPESIETAARQIRSLLREFWPDGPYALAGFSWAGLLAFEVARQCAHEEGFTPFCAVLGTTAPARKLSFAGRLLHTLRWLPGWAWWALRTPGSRISRLREIFSTRYVQKLLGKDELEMPDWANGSPIMTRFIEIAQIYHPVVSRPVPVHLFRERGSFRNKSHPGQFNLTDHLTDGGWSRWMGCTPEIHWLDGEHLEVLKQPLVGRTARELQAVLDHHFARTARAVPDRKSGQGEPAAGETPTATARK